MGSKVGRPSKKSAEIAAVDAKQQIIDAAVTLIRKIGADHLTIRKVVEESFAETSLYTPLSDPAGRICELYMHLVRRYMDLGTDFMANVYTTGNQALSAYMGTESGAFAPDTVMFRCHTDAVVPVRVLRILQILTNRKILLCSRLRFLSQEKYISDDRSDHSFKSSMSSPSARP